MYTFISHIIKSNIFKLPNGKLTTMYHYMEKMDDSIENSNEMNSTEMTEEVDA